MHHALIVDDDLSFQLGLAESVRLEGFSVATASSLAAARQELSKTLPDVLFIDLNLPDGSGLELLQGLETPPETVLVTGQASLETAVEALRRGVADYLTKPIDFARVKMLLANVARTRELKEEIGGLRGELRKLGRFRSLIGAAPAMQAVYDLISRVSKTDATTLITGDTGTGKEVVAQTIHQLSRRHREPFLPVHCGAVSATLIESVLFGHERGSFTGADRLHKGYFDRAHRGTIFLDEITEMPLELQGRLLRVLETSEFTRVGGTEPIKINIRVIVATNRCPQQAVDDGKLREDLLYRLNTFPIHLPPLLDRGEDVDLLAEHFLALLNKEEGTSKAFTGAALERLRAHRWPGNVRELRNVVQRAFIMAEDEDTIGVDGIPLGVAERPSGVSQEASGATLVLQVGISAAETERRLILATLEGFDGDKQKTADVLKISVKKLYNRLREYRASS